MSSSSTREVSYVGGAEGLTGLGADRVTAAVHLGLVGVRQRALVTGLICRGEAVMNFQRISLTCKILSLGILNE